MYLDRAGHSWESFWSSVGNFFANVGKVIGGGLLAIAGAAFTIITLPIALIIPGGGFLTQIGFSTAMYGGFVAASVFDSQVKSDMQAIGWNPFNSDASLLTGYLNGRKVSFYKGMPAFFVNHSSGRSGSFLGIWLTGNNNENDIKHEWGHGFQQGIMGAARYGLFVGIPSYFEWGPRSYYDKPWERIADIIGGVSRSVHTSSGESLAWWHLVVATLFGPFSYFFGL